MLGLFKKIISRLSLRDKTTDENNYQKLESSKEKSNVVYPDRNLPFDQQIIYFINELDEFFNNKISAINKNITISPILKTDIDSSKTYLKIINMMKIDHKILINKLNYYQAQKSIEGIEACNNLLIRYLSGFIVNLNKILSSYQNIINIVVATVDIEKYRIERDIIMAKNQILQELHIRFMQQTKALEYLNHVLNLSNTSSWQQVLTNRLISADLPIYNEILLDLASDCEYDYLQLMYKISELEIVADLYCQKSEEIIQRKYNKIQRFTTNNKTDNNSETELVLNQDNLTHTSSLVFKILELKKRQEYNRYLITEINNVNSGENSDLNLGLASGLRKDFIVKCIT